MSKNSSAVKKEQVSIRNYYNNKVYKSNIKTSIKKYLVSINNINNVNCNDALENLSSVYSIIDKAVKKGVLHKNNGSRKKALLVTKMKTALNL